MKKQLKRVIQKFTKSAAKRAVSTSTAAVTKLPQGEKLFVTQLSGATSSNGVRGKVGHVLLVNSALSPAELERAADQAGVATPEFLERLARRVESANLDEAIRLRRRVVELEPENPYRYAELAAKLEKVTAEGVTRHPILGLTAGKVRPHTEEAIKLLQKAVQLKPNSAEWMYRLGSCSSKTVRPRTA